MKLQEGMCRNQYGQCLDNQNWTVTHYTVLDSDSSYEDCLGKLLLFALPTNDYHCVG